MVKKIALSRNYPLLEEYLLKNQSLLILGPRGSGKTFYLSNLVEQSKKVTKTLDLLKGSVYERYLRNADLLEKEIVALNPSESHQVLIFIDEIQRIPSLLNEVHRLIELYKPWLQFLLTGSSARKLKKENANLLAGRAFSCDFHPLGVDEVNFCDHESVLLQYGALPQVFTESDTLLKQGFLSSYVGTYLDEEIKREALLRNLPAFARFLEMVAIENGALINYSKIARFAGIADVTVKEYYQLLVDTLVGMFLPAWNSSIRKQMLLKPKFYLFDNGVVNALTGELGTQLRPSTNRFGKLFESFVITQINQYIQKHSISLNLHHYREKNGREIDLILQKNPFSTPYAIEIKSSENPTLKQVKSLQAFKELYPESECYVICRTLASYREEEVTFLSLDSFLEQIMMGT